MKEDSFSDERRRSVKLCNVHWTMKVAEIEQLCAKYGKVERVCFEYPIGSVNVTMSTEDEAKKVFANLDGKEIKNLTVRVKWSKTLETNKSDSTEDTFLQETRSKTSKMNLDKNKNGSN